MSSQKKMRKLRNSYCFKTDLKEKDTKLKRILFFTSSQRRVNNSRAKIEGEQSEAE